MDTLLLGLDDNVGQVSQDLWGRYMVVGMPVCAGVPTWGLRCTCIRILIPKTSSLLDRMHLTKAQPELIKEMVKRRVLFILAARAGE